MLLYNLLCLLLELWHYFMVLLKLNPLLLHPVPTLSFLLQLLLQSTLNIFVLSFSKSDTHKADPLRFVKTTCPLSIWSTNAFLLNGRATLISNWADAKDIVMRYIPGSLSIPDGLTKALGWVLHSHQAHRMLGYFLNALSVATISLLYLILETDLENFPTRSIPLSVCYTLDNLHSLMLMDIAWRYQPSAWKGCTGTLWGTQTDKVVNDTQEILYRISSLFY